MKKKFAIQVPVPAPTPYSSHSFPQKWTSERLHPNVSHADHYIPDKKNTPPQNFNPTVGVWWDSDFPSTIDQHQTRQPFIHHTLESSGKVPSWEKSSWWRLIYIREEGGLKNKEKSQLQVSWDIWPLCMSRDTQKRFLERKRFSQGICWEFKENSGKERPSAGKSCPTCLWKFSKTNT